MPGLFQISEAELLLSSTEFALTGPLLDSRCDLDMLVRSLSLSSLSRKMRLFTVTLLTS